MSENIPYEFLKRIKELLDAGILTQEEFNKEKAKILGNTEDAHLTDEQKARLKKIEALKEAGILTVEEYEEQKRAILSHRRTYQANSNSSGAQQTTTVCYSPSPAPKKKNSTLWIILGVVACVLVVLLALGGGSGDYSGGYDGIMSNPYSTVDYYINNNDNYWREGNTVYYTEQQDEYGVAGILGNIFRNPSTEFGQMFSGAVREGGLNVLIQEDYQLFQAIAKNGLDFKIVWGGKVAFVYSSEEIRMKMSY